MARTKQTMRAGGKTPSGPFRTPVMGLGKSYRPVQQQKTKRRTKAGTKAKREIRKYQNSTDLLIPKASFQNLVREMMQDFMTDLRMEKKAFLSLQEAAEAYLVQVLEQADKIAKNGKRKTIQLRDLKLACELRLDKHRLGEHP